MEQNTLNVHVSNLKKALKDEGSCIETVHNIGYRWNQPVTKGDECALTQRRRIVKCFLFARIRFILRTWRCMDMEFDALLEQRRSIRRYQPGR